MIETQRTKMPRFGTIRARLHFLEDGRRGWLIKQRLTSNGNISSRLYSTIDAGLQWEQVVHFARDISDLCVVDARTLFVGGDGGFVSRTTDGGQTWQRLNTRYRGFINSVQFYNRHLGLLLGDFGVMSLTRDGGETWQRIRVGKEVGSLVAANFLSKSRVVVTGMGAIYSLRL